MASDAIVVDLDRNKIKLGFETPTIPSPPSRKWSKLSMTLRQSLGDIYERAHGHDASHDGRKTESLRRRDVRESTVWKEKLESLDFALNLAYSPDSNLMDDFTADAAIGANGQTQWEIVQEAFLRFFVTLFKDYRKYLKVPLHGTSHGRPSFAVDEFLRVQPQNNLPFMQGKYRNFLFPCHPFGR